MSEEENRGSAKGLESMASIGPTGDAGTSDDANWIGTTDNVRPADIHATGGSGDTPGTIGDATGPLATPSIPSGGEGRVGGSRTDPGIGELPTNGGLGTGSNTGSSAEMGPEGGAGGEPGEEPRA